jgi:hypothetical protein
MSSQNKVPEGILTASMEDTHVEVMQQQGGDLDEQDIEESIELSHKLSDEKGMVDVGVALLLEEDKPLGENHIEGMGA